MTTKNLPSHFAAINAAQTEKLLARPNSSSQDQQETAMTIPATIAFSTPDGAQHDAIQVLGGPEEAAELLKLAGHPRNWALDPEQGRAIFLPEPDQFEWTVDDSDADPIYLKAHALDALLSTDSRLEARVQRFFSNAFWGLDDLLTVELMPASLRESHRAAGNSGRWPDNGSQRYVTDRATAKAFCDGDEFNRTVDQPLAFAWGNYDYFNGEEL